MVTVLYLDQPVCQSSALLQPRRGRRRVTKSDEERVTGREDNPSQNRGNPRERKKQIMRTRPRILMNPLLVERS